MEDDMSNLSERKRLLSKDINDLKEAYDKMEFRYAMNEISKDILIDREKIKRRNRPKSERFRIYAVKKSNLEKGMKYF